MNNYSHAMPPIVLKVCAHIKQQGGQAWLVGGAVRDLYLQRPMGDLDLEVFGLSFSSLCYCLRQLGRCSVVGKQFGVIKLHVDGCDLDIALPRREKKSGQGHRGFEVTPDPELDVRTATLRRDFTINAMMLDPLEHCWLDFHGGREDAQAHVLRHVSAAFAEDPLRPLRAMQLAARLDMRLHPLTAKLCQSMYNEASTLPRERIWHEWRKWTLASTPSAGLRCLQDCGWLSCYPMLLAMPQCQQDSRWHPEGNVWLHTLQVVDQMARIAEEQKLDDEPRQILLLAALLHDVAKPITTFVDERGGIRSPGHAEAAEPLVEQFLQSIAMPKQRYQAIQHLVREHLVHLHSKPSKRAVRRLSHRLAPATIQQWEMLVEADASGRFPQPVARPAKAWLELAQAMDVQSDRPSPIVNGKMLIRLGVPPGVEMGKIIRQAYDVQLDGGFNSEAEAQVWCGQWFKFKDDERKKCVDKS